MKIQIVFMVISWQSSIFQSLFPLEEGSIISTTLLLCWISCRATPALTATPRPAVLQDILLTPRNMHSSYIHTPMKMHSSVFAYISKKNKKGNISSQH